MRACTAPGPNDTKRIYLSVWNRVHFSYVGLSVCKCHDFITPLVLHDMVITVVQIRLARS